MNRSTEALYQPFQKHPALFGDTFRAEWLHPDTLSLVQRIQQQDKHEQIAVELLFPWIRQELPEVYSFDCFSPLFLQLFNEEIEHFYEVSASHSIPVRRPNSMNNYGVIVNEIGMRRMIDSLQINYIWPIAKQLFPREASQFDDHHSFLVRYQADEDLGLDMHTDDSDVTFNVCLGHQFTGATLQFCGTMGAANHRHSYYMYHHSVGRAVLHLGSRRHGADDIESGTRANLIVWNHNWHWRDSPEYKRRLSVVQYEKEQGKPDLICLSYTHDRDYAAYKELPPGLKGQHRHPWCPPAGREYEGYEDIWDDTTTIYKVEER